MAKKQKQEEEMRAMAPPPMAAPPPPSYSAPGPAPGPAYGAPQPSPGFNAAPPPMASPPPMGIAQPPPSPGYSMAPPSNLGAPVSISAAPAVTHSPSDRASLGRIGASSIADLQLNSAPVQKQEEKKPPESNKNRAFVLCLVANIVISGLGIVNIALASRLSAYVADTILSWSCTILIGFAMVFMASDESERNGGIFMVFLSIILSIEFISGFTKIPTDPVMFLFNSLWLIPVLCGVTGGIMAIVDGSKVTAKVTAIRALSGENYVAGLIIAITILTIIFASIFEYFFFKDDVLYSVKAGFATAMIFMAIGAFIMIFNIRL